MKASLSRRRFLAAGTAATLGLAASSIVGNVAGADPVPAGPAVQNDPYGGFKVGVQSYSFRHFNLEQTVQKTADLGLHYIEFYNGHLPTNSTQAQIDAVKNLCTRNHITPIAFGVERFTKSDADNRKLFEFARKLGVRYLSADPEPDSFDSLDKLVAEFNIGIAIHPHGPQGGNALHRWYAAEPILAAIKDRHKLIGTCLDTGHLIRCAQPPHNKTLDVPDQIRRMGARNLGFHLKDHDNAKNTDVVLGKGVLNMENVLKAIRAVKFEGWISIEYEANENNPSPDIRACLEVLRDAIAKTK